jgi:hypothetical protein
MVHDLRMKQVQMPVIPSRERIEKRLAEVRAIARKLEVLLLTAAEMDAIDGGKDTTSKVGSALENGLSRNLDHGRNEDSVGGEQ